MKAIMVMYDSLNRNFLSPYGCDWVHSPNFTRLAERTVTFDNSFVGSMPCMPARRELHTGRYNFLHRSWGPLEPFDDSMPQILKNNGVYTHLISDHYHYWEDGGCNYHNRYSSWEISRGQEGDLWKAVVGDFEEPENINRKARHDWVNRSYMPNIEDQPQGKTFGLAMEFLERNHEADNWFLHIETFDPHEPYFSDQKYKDLYPDKWSGPISDWPSYGPVTESPEHTEHLRFENAALISMCDESLGRVLDFMDRNDMWKDTMLIVNTDHGFLLGEHDMLGKCHMPFYNEVARTPLFIWDPRVGKQGERRRSLAQNIDWAPTLLEFFDVAIPPDMQGVPLKDTVDSDKAVRQAGLFGIHGGHVNVTDGRYVYMRAAGSPENTPLYQYTVMPTHMRGFFSLDALHDAELAAPFPFTKGCPSMKIPVGPRRNPRQCDTLLFDNENDPGQMEPLHDETIEAKMIESLVRIMKETDAPAEQFERLGL